MYTVSIMFVMIFILPLQLLFCCDVLTVGLMSSVRAAQRPRSVRPSDDLANLFLLPSMTLSDTAYGSNPDSGMLVFIK